MAINRSIAAVIQITRDEKASEETNKMQAAIMVLIQSIVEAGNSVRRV